MTAQRGRTGVRVTRKRDKTTEGHKVSIESDALRESLTKDCEAWAASMDRQESAVAGMSSDERIAVAKRMLQKPPSMWTQITWWDRGLMLDFLAKAACPVVCRGYLDGGENWHELCIAKAEKALAALGDMDS